MPKSKFGVALILIGVLFIFIDWFVLYWVESLLLTFVGIVFICIGICVSVKSSKKPPPPYTFQPPPQYYQKPPSQYYQQVPAQQPFYMPQPEQNEARLQPLGTFRYCPHCGAPVQGKFCVECGKPIE